MEADKLGGKERLIREPLDEGRPCSWCGRGRCPGNGDALPPGDETPFSPLRSLARIHGLGESTRPVSTLPGIAARFLAAPETRGRPAFTSLRGFVSRWRDREHAGRHPRLVAFSRILALDLGLEAG